MMHYVHTFIFSADREVQRILLELLNQMDGFDQTVNVKVSQKIKINKKEDIKL